MINSQTIISIRRDKVEQLRELNKNVPNFFKNFISFYNVSSYPLYIGDAIYVSHSEHSSIASSQLITPFMGATFTYFFHKSYDVKENNSVEWFEKNKVIENLIMGYKGVFKVKKIEALEIESEFATAKNSVYSVFGLNDNDIDNFTDEDFEKILDITDFKYKEKQKEQALIKSLTPSIHYMGAFAQRQACLAMQSDGVFKAHPFKSNKTINFDLKELDVEFKEEAAKTNPRFSFAQEEEKERMLMQYVSSFDLRTKLGNRVFEAFIFGLKGKAVAVTEETKPKK